MLIIPAIDLKDVRCVRLEQGDMATATVFSDDPSKTAAHWAGLGARRELERLLAGARLQGAVAGLLEVEVKELPEIGLVVDNQHQAHDWMVPRRATAIGNVLVKYLGAVLGHALGKSTVNVLPLPITLSTVTLPP